MDVGVEVLVAVGVWVGVAVGVEVLVAVGVGGVQHPPTSVMVNTAVPPSVLLLIQAASAPITLGPILTPIDDGCP